MEVLGVRIPSEGVDPVLGQGHELARALAINGANHASVALFPHAFGRSEFSGHQRRLGVGLIKSFFKALQAHPGRRSSDGAISWPFKLRGLIAWSAGQTIVLRLFVLGEAEAGEGLTGIGAFTRNHGNGGRSRKRRHCLGECLRHRGFGRLQRDDAGGGGSGRCCRRRWNLGPTLINGEPKTGAERQNDWWIGRRRCGFVDRGRGVALSFWIRLARAGTKNNQRAQKCRSGKGSDQRAGSSLSRCVKQTNNDPKKNGAVRM